ncbi:MAG: YafY family protein [Deinococcota bacterium]
MRADRLLSIMLMLQNEGKITTRNLAKRLEVSERTILRDMDALTTANIPVYAERGTKGGWQLLDNYRTNLTGMSERELLTVFAIRMSPFLEDLGLDKAAETALMKVSASLPVTKQHDVNLVKKRLLIDSPSVEEDNLYLPKIQKAIWNNRQLRFQYQNFDNKVSERAGSPLGLVLQGKRWYLIAHTTKGLRTFRVSRILEAEPLEQVCYYPEDFDLEKFWQESKKSFKATLPTYFVTVEMCQKAFERFGLIGRYAKLLESTSLANGWLKAQIQFETEQDALAWALSLGNKVKIVTPEKLKQKLLGQLIDIKQIYF